MFGSARGLHRLRSALPQEEVMVNASAIVDDWLGAIEARDTKRVKDALADEVEVEIGGLERVVLTKETLSPFLDRLNAYESIRLVREKFVASGPEVACLMRARVKMASTNLSMLGEELPTAGKELEVLGALFVTVNDAGKISYLARVQDTLATARQLGISPERMSALMDKVKGQLR